MLANTFSAASNSRITAVLSIAKTWDDAVDFLMEVKGPASGKEVIHNFVQETLLVDSPRMLIKINRDSIWREGLRLYKVSLADKTVLLKKFASNLKMKRGLMLVH